LGVRLKLCVTNFAMIWLMVQKLLAFLFSIWNALKVPQNWGFGDFGGENWNIYLSKPQKAPPWAKPRVLTYHSPKSAHAFDLGAIPRKKKQKRKKKARKACIWRNFSIAWRRHRRFDPDQIWHIYWATVAYHGYQFSARSVKNWTCEAILKISHYGQSSTTSLRTINTA
jgi:hypothetical protein